MGAGAEAPGRPGQRLSRDDQLQVLLGGRQVPVPLGPDHLADLEQPRLPAPPPARAAFPLRDRHRGRQTQTVHPGRQRAGVRSPGEALGQSERPLLEPGAQCPPGVLRQRLGAGRHHLGQSARRAELEGQRNPDLPRAGLEDQLEPGGHRAGRQCCGQLHEDCEGKQ